MPTSFLPRFHSRLTSPGPELCYAEGMLSESQVQQALLGGDVLTVEMNGSGVVTACHFPTTPDDVPPALFRQYLAAGWIRAWCGGVLDGVSQEGRGAFCDAG